MGQIAQHGQGLANDLIPLLSLDMDNKPHAAGVPFILRMVEALRSGPIHRRELAYWSLLVRKIVINGMVCLLKRKLLVCLWYNWIFADITNIIFY